MSDRPIPTMATGPSTDVLLADALSTDALSSGPVVAACRMPMSRRPALRRPALRRPALRVRAFRTVTSLVAVSLALFGLVSAPAAVAQERATLESLDGRLQRVERVMDASLLDQLQRIDALQQEIRQLRGEIENLNNDLDKQTRRGTDLYGDTDQRLTDLEEARDAGSLFGGGLLDESGLSEDGPSPLDETAAPRSTVIVPRGGARIPAAASFGDGPQPPTGRLRDTATQAEKSSYTGAYDLLARGENEAAVAAFDAFLRSFPDGPYSDNAWYWQGEAMYAQRRFDEARRNFGAVVNSFPESTKVPDARLKIGFALYEQGAHAEARRILTGVQDDYPGRSAAVLARKRLQQMSREGR